MHRGTDQAVFERQGREQSNTHIHIKVYSAAMARTNIEIDDRLVDRARSLYNLRTKREVVDLALRRLVGEPMSRSEALAMEGSGWSGDLDEIRAREEIPRR